MPWLMMGTLSRVGYRYSRTLDISQCAYSRGRIEAGHFVPYGNFRLRCPANPAARVLNLHTHCLDQSLRHPPALAVPLPISPRKHGLEFVGTSG